jgi:hypothetical protein
VCSECGQRLVEVTESPSCLHIGIGVIVILLFLPVAACGALCVVTGAQAGQAGVQFLLIGAVLLLLSGGFIYAAVEFMKRK